MSQFIAYKNSITAYYNDCIEFARRNEFSSYIQAMEEQKKKIEDDKMVILTCGEMKRGKSSLLTALLEDEGLFPVNIAVTTCLVTMVSYGEQEKVTVILEDDQGVETSKLITREEIGDYVMEQGNAANYKRAKLILIETPNQKLKNGFVFVDTPGVGSMNPEHSQITYGFINRADVILFVSDATAPLTEPELGFLKQIKNQCNNIIFPLTKKDLEANFQEIIDTNREKISQYTQMEKDKILIIPVSSTAKISYLNSGRERMLKTSNFEVFEDLLWDMLYKNRANIIFFPPMKELAEVLKKIEKDIFVNETAYAGNADELNKLKDRFVLLSNQKQELLNNASNWQADIQRRVDGLLYATDRIIDEFSEQALNHLNNELKNPKNVADPSALLNGVIGMMSNASVEMNRELVSRLTEIKTDFETKTGFDFYNELGNELFSVKTADFNLKKLSTVDKLIDNGRTISSTSMGITAVGTVAGTMIGGVIGILGGPVGMIAGAQVGAMFGGAAGGLRGTLQVIKNPTYHTEPQVRNEITRYINSNCNTWRKEAPRCLREIKEELIVILKESIEENKKALDADIARMKEIAESSQKELQEGKLKYQSIRREYEALSKRFAEIIQTKMEDDSKRPEMQSAKTTAFEPLEQNGPDNEQAVSYSYLEE